ncbi:MAG: hypothetical protein ACHQIH_01760 [Ignavibacteria bacterium]
MLTRILIMALALLNTLSSYSQEKNTFTKPAPHGDWSISYNAGINMDYDKNTGYKISMELGFSESPSRELLLNLSSSAIPVSHSTGYSLLECSIGPRFLLFKDKILFLEGNIGAQINNRTREYYKWDYGYNGTSTQTRSGFYFAAGVGAKIHISGNNSFLLRVKYNTTVPYSEGLTYLGAQFGLDFNTSEPVRNSKIENKKFSLSIGGGINSPYDPDGYSNSGKGVYLIEGSYQTGQKNEVFLEASYSEINVNYHAENTGMLDINFGPRFYINKSALSSFIEFGGGVYILTKDDGSENDPVQPGINIGTGFTGRLNSLMALFLKGKIHILFTENLSFPPYSSLAGGLRFNL